MGGNPGMAGASPMDRARRASSGRAPRKSIALALKLEVLRRLAAGERQFSVCNALGLAGSTVRTIARNRDKILRLEGAAPLWREVEAQAAAQAAHATRAAALFRQSVADVLCASRRHAPLFEMQTTTGLYELSRFINKHHPNGFLHEDEWGNEVRRLYRQPDVDIKVEPDSQNSPVNDRDLHSIESYTLNLSKKRPEEPPPACESDSDVREEENRENESSSDEFDAFGSYVARSFKKLPLTRALHLQDKINSLIKEERLAYLNSMNENSDCSK